MLYVLVVSVSAPSGALEKMLWARALPRSTSWSIGAQGSDIDRQ